MDLDPPDYSVEVKKSKKRRTNYIDFKKDKVGKWYILLTKKERFIEKATNLLTYSPS